MAQIEINIEKPAEMPVAGVRSESENLMLMGTPGAPASTPPVPMDSYFSKLLKLIPAEVLAIYLTGLGLIPSPIPDNQKFVLPLWLVICVIFVIVFRSQLTTDEKKGPIPRIIAFSVISFVVYSYAMGGPWDVYNLYIPYVGGLLVLSWTFIAPYLYGKSWSEVIPN